MAVLSITGGLRTAPSDTLCVHAHLPPMELTLERICHRAALRLATLPTSHPLHKPLRAFVKRHRSPLHYLSHLFQIKPDKMEKVQTFTFAPNGWFPYKTRIAKTREETKAILDGDTADAKIFTDGQQNAATICMLHHKG
jgi:hypothetical protein